MDVDRAFNENEQSGATGAVVRDWNGDFQIAQTIWYGHVAGDADAEALAFPGVVRLAVAGQFKGKDKATIQLNLYFFLFHLYTSRFRVKSWMLDYIIPYLLSL